MPRDVIPEQVAKANGLHRSLKRLLRHWATGAIKYADLKNNRLTNYTFNFDQMLDIRGNTAVYLLYAHARICCSIIRKSGKDIEEIKQTGKLQLLHASERSLGLQLIRFGEFVEDAATDLLPNVTFCVNISTPFLGCSQISIPTAN